jgi:hypothetical protein
MLTMLDMVQKPNEYTFSEFIARQVELGGIDLLSFSRPGMDWKYSYLRARAAFLEQFHRYCQEQAPNFQHSWSSWKGKNIQQTH